MFIGREKERQKIKHLKVAKTISIRPVLIYEGKLSESIIRENFFRHVIAFGDLLI